MAKFNIKFLPKTHYKTDRSYYLVDPNLWLIIGIFGGLFSTVGGVLYYMHRYTIGLCLVLIGFVIVLYTMDVWWRNITREATFENYRGKVVPKRSRLGRIVFTVFGIMFFFALSYFNVVSAHSIDGVWFSKAMLLISTYVTSLTNTPFSVPAEATVSWAHYMVFLRALVVLVTIFAMLSILDLFTIASLYSFIFVGWVYLLLACNFVMSICVVVCVAVIYPYFFLAVGLFTHAYTGTVAVVDIKCLIIDPLNSLIDVLLVYSTTLNSLAVSACYDCMSGVQIGCIIAGESWVKSDNTFTVNVKFPVFEKNSNIRQKDFDGTYTWCTEKSFYGTRLLHIPSEFSSKVLRANLLKSGPGEFNDLIIKTYSAGSLQCVNSVTLCTGPEDVVTPAAISDLFPFRPQFLINPDAALAISVATEAAIKKFNGVMGYWAPRGGMATKDTLLRTPHKIKSKYFDKGLYVIRCLNGRYYIGSFTETMKARFLKEHAVLTNDNFHSLVCVLTTDLPYEEDEIRAYEVIFQRIVAEHEGYELKKVRQATGTGFTAQYLEVSLSRFLLTTDVLTNFTLLSKEDTDYWSAIHKKRATDLRNRREEAEEKLKKEKAEGKEPKKRKNKSSKQKSG